MLTRGVPREPLQPVSLQRQHTEDVRPGLLVLLYDANLDYKRKKGSRGGRKGVLGGKWAVRLRKKGAPKQRRITARPRCVLTAGSPG